jgi:hypothetical protein
MDYKKAQAAENKKKATSLAVASADEAAASGAAYVITKVLALPLPGPAELSWRPCSAVCHIKETPQEWLASLER